jgi:hypothetical protein
LEILGPGDGYEARMEGAGSSSFSLNC